MELDGAPLGRSLHALRGEAPFRMIQAATGEDGTASTMDTSMTAPLT